MIFLLNVHQAFAIPVYLFSVKQVWFMHEGHPDIVMKNYMLITGIH